MAHHQTSATGTPAWVVGLPVASRPLAPRLRVSSTRRAAGGAVHASRAAGTSLSVPVLASMRTAPTTPSTATSASPMIATAPVVGCLHLTGRRGPTPDVGDDTTPDDGSGGDRNGGVPAEPAEVVPTPMVANLVPIGRR